MIDTVKLRFPTHDNKHLFRLGSKLQKIATLKQSHDVAGLVVMDIREYHNEDGSDLRFYKFTLVRPNGYEIRVTGNDYFLSLEYSVTKFFYGTSYVYVNDASLLKRSIEMLGLRDWTISRLDICYNRYFDNCPDSELYLGLVHSTHKGTFNTSYRTGFTKLSKSSYSVVYLKHKDPRDVKLEIPILRFETKITMRNTYKFRQIRNILTINEENLDTFVFLGFSRMNKLREKFHIDQMPADYCSKKASVKQKRMFTYLKLYGTFENALDIGVISRATYFSWKKQKLNVLDSIPPYYDSMPFKFQLVLDNYLMKNKKNTIMLPFIKK